MVRRGLYLAIGTRTLTTRWLDSTQPEESSKMKMSSGTTAMFSEDQWGSNGKGFTNKGLVSMQRTQHLCYNRTLLLSVCAHLPVLLFLPLYIVLSETYNFSIFALCEYLDKCHDVTRPSSWKCTENVSEGKNRPFFFWRWHASCSAPDLQFALVFRGWRQFFQFRSIKSFFYLSVSKGSAEEEGKKRSGRPGLKCSLTQKQLEYVRPWGKSAFANYSHCLLLTCVFIYFKWFVFFVT